MAAAVLCSRGVALSVSCFLLAVPLLMAQDPSNLSLEHYAKTCPNVEHVVRTEMECAVRDEPRNAALMLRLHFHDCFVQVDYQNTIF
jgi:peroxidase